MDQKSRAALVAILLAAMSIKLSACVSNAGAPPAAGIDGAVPEGDSSPLVEDAGGSLDTGLSVDAPNGADVNEDAGDDAAPMGFDAACPSSGIDAGGQCLVELATGFHSVYGIAIDSTTVYFTAITCDGGGAVVKVPINGGAAVPIAEGQTNPQNVAVDAKNVYWSDVPPDAGGGGGTLSQVSKNGGTITPLASGSSSASPGTPTAMVSDGTNVYFASGTYLDNGGTPLLIGGSIQRVPVGGGNITPIASNTAGPYAVAIDANQVYWTAYAGGANDGQVLAAPKGGFTDGGIPQALVYSVGAPGPIAVDATNVYFATLAYPAFVYSVPIGGDPGQTGTQLQTLPGNEYPWGFAIDSANVYFTNLFQPGGTPAPQPGANGVVNALAKDGGVPAGWTDAGPPGPYQHVVDTPTGYGFLGPLLIAVDAYNLYWSDTDGNVWQISKPGRPF